MRTWKRSHGEVSHSRRRLSEEGLDVKLDFPNTSGGSVPVAMALLCPKAHCHLSTMVGDIRRYGARIAASPHHLQYACSKVMLESCAIRYYGNAFAFSAAIATAGDLSTKPLDFAVGLVKMAKDEVTEEYMRSLADLMVIRNRPHFAVMPGGGGWSVGSDVLGGECHGSVRERARGDVGRSRWPEKGGVHRVSYVN
ncbi:hypothetical protein SASPL_137970 [Salvia splendens]|uniref:Uncharacterized protein n=1 Tax=Salvia splendens TaxID=180675 RepID=A0A8X8WUA4_SALSN|nr:hypothetical protein SASPL_137970 [Salvia splendens]